MIDNQTIEWLKFEFSRFFWQNTEGASLGKILKFSTSYLKFFAFPKTPNTVYPKQFFQRD